MRVNHRIWKFVAAFVVVALVPTLVNAVASAHNLQSHDPLQSQITERDNLIFNQESLLNTYRCLFNVDTQVVPGGCVDGKPADDVPRPDEFAGTPTQSEVDARDNLISNQESLLNTYRCLFNVDTQIVPGGCVDGKPAEKQDDSTPAVEPPVESTPTVDTTAEVLSPW